MEPPPSLPVAMGRRPPATAAAVPPDDPPGVRSGFQGFRVVPCSTVDVQLMPPNSGAVVCAARIAPVARDGGVVVAGDAVLEDHRRLRVRPALDLLELLDAEGDATEGQADVCRGRGVAGAVEIGETGHVERGPFERGDA